MKIIVLNGKQMTSKENLYQHLQKEFSLPFYFGNNLDALWDILNEEIEPTVIEFLNPKDVAKNLGAYGEKFIQLLKSLEEDNNLYTIRFSSDQ